MHTWVIIFAARHGILSLNIPYGVPTPAAAFARVNSTMPGSPEAARKHGVPCGIRDHPEHRCVVEYPKSERPGHAYEQEIA